MSVEAIAVCLHHSKAKGTAKLVLLGIANHDGDGGAWPTVATLAKYASVHPRKVQEALSKLAATGEIRVYRQAGGTQELEAWERPNRYEVLVMCPSWCDRSKHHRDTRSRQTRIALPVDKPGAGIGTPYQETGGGVPESAPGGVPESAPKPSIEPLTNPVPAPTTDRARPGPVDNDRPPPPANPPADELAKVRERLKQASTEHHNREREPRSRQEDK